MIINIGSNLGDRKLNLSKAMVQVGRIFGEFELSHAIETEPWGFSSTRPFLNMCMMLQTAMQPHEVLRALQQVERNIDPAPHRDAAGNYIDRRIDIDILAIDDKVIESDTLTLPHPRLAERRFYLEPMAELAPGWVHPVTGVSAAEMLARLPQPENNGE